MLRSLTALTALALVAVVVAGVGATGPTTQSASAAKADTRLSLVGYAVPREALGAIIKAWQQTPQGKDVTFTESYSASGDQARAVAAGLRADIVHLSTELDVDVIVRAGLIDSNWRRSQYKGIASNSVVVFALRDGNPKKIRRWQDLARPGVEIVTPNPFSSGAAKWNVLAAYGAMRKLGKTDRQAQDFVLRMFRNVVSQDTSGRNATNTFLSGKGDVFITYENEARLAKLPYVIPKQTLLIEAPIAVLKNSQNRQKAQQFVNFVKSPAGQRIYGQYGYRPIPAAVYNQFRTQYPKRAGIFTIDDKFIRGWTTANAKWFDPKRGIMVRINRAVGGPTG